jgi:transcriptional regulator GlxA family with amidase domain
LILAFIEEDHGPERARRVALGMVTYLKRPGDQAQMSLFTITPRPHDRLVHGVLDHVMAHPDGDLRTAVLATNAGECASPDAPDRDITELLWHLGVDDSTSHPPDG